MPLNENSTEDEINTYNSEYAVFKVILDTARSKVDRIAFCGQVPVNVYNSNVGDYILPIRNDDNSITGVSISSSSINLTNTS